MKDRFDKRNFIFFAGFAVFFGYLYVTGEPIYAGDTFQYENQMVMREPGYALFMQLARFLAGDNSYQLIILLQNLLAVVANTYVIVFFRRHFNLDMALSLLFSAIMLVPHVATTIFSTTSLVLTNSLMTEGVLFSLYPLALLWLIEAWEDGKPLGKSSLKALCLMLLLSLIRSQMMVLFVVWFMEALVMCLLQNHTDVKDKIKKGCTAVCLLVLVFAIRTLLVYTYNYCENGLFVNTASGDAMSFANVLYVADREDGEAIEDDALRELFYEMYDAADNDKMNYKYAGSGLLARAAYHEYCHDELNFTYFAEPAKRYVGETKGIYVDKYQELMIAIDEIASELSSELMPVVIKKYFVNYLAVIALGFVRTVAYENTILAWYALFIYIFAIAVTCFLLKKDPKSREAFCMGMLLVTIVGNVCGTALMIQCISRYMIYNMPLFYIAGILELRAIYRMVKNKRGGLENGLQKS